MTSPVKKLYRSRTDRMLFGICAGLGHYLGTDPTVIRVIAVIAAFVSLGTAALVYLVAAFIIPEQP